MSTLTESLTGGGSSPRTRGARCIYGINQFIHRIIPADAGSTSGPAGPGRHRPDHPPGCGEHLGAGARVAGVDGSSPRMRGARVQGRRGAALHGIIPADAGSTRSDTITWPSPQDHPRGCGEHRRFGRRQPLPVRIIPADAGSTRTRRSESPS